MVGFRKDYSPIPTATLSLDNPTQDMSGVSLGTRWRPNDRISMGLGAIRYWVDVIDVTDNVNNPPFNAKGHGSILSVGADALVRF